METIFAQASAPGRAGISVIRLSGPDALNICERIAGPLPVPRVATLRRIKGTDGAQIDEALVITFPAPHSFTGEDVVELHLHGSIAVQRAVLSLLADQPDTRLAEAGEFTRRALENDRLDLAQVEGLADLIDAETESQRKQAMRVLAGALGDLVERWRRDLIRAAALLEATIDFADEDVPVDVTPEVRSLLDQVLTDVDREIAGTAVAERVRSGFEVAIVGAPNVGKSTLLNKLAGREAAITSEIAGTTRDVIEVRMDLGGIPVTILDTAGLRDSEDEIESIGIRKAVQRAREADLRILLSDTRDANFIKLSSDDIWMKPKADERADKLDSISGVTGEGVDELVKRVQSFFKERTATIGTATHARHRIAMQKAADGLRSAKRELEYGPDHYDIVAEELRFAVRALEGLLGRIDVENLLDEIFLSFCIGK